MGLIIFFTLPSSVRKRCACHHRAASGGGPHAHRQEHRHVWITPDKSSLLWSHRVEWVIIKHHIAISDYWANIHQRPQFSDWRFTLISWMDGGLTNKTSQRGYFLSSFGEIMLFLDWIQTCIFKHAFSIIMNPQGSALSKHESLS